MPNSIAFSSSSALLSHPIPPISWTPTRMHPVRRYEQDIAAFRAQKAKEAGSREGVAGGKVGGQPRAVKARRGRGGKVSGVAYKGAPRGAERGLKNTVRVPGPCGVSSVELFPGIK